MESKLKSLFYFPLRISFICIIKFIYFSQQYNNAYKNKSIDKTNLIEHLNGLNKLRLVYNKSSFHIGINSSNKEEK